MVYGRRPIAQGWHVRCFSRAGVMEGYMAFRRFALILPVAALIAGCQAKPSPREQALDQRVQQLEQQLVDARTAAANAASVAMDAAETSRAVAPAPQVQAAPRPRTAPAPVVRTQARRTTSSSSSSSAPVSARSSAGTRTVSRGDDDVRTRPAGEERYGRGPSAEPAGNGRGDDDVETARVEPVEPRATAMVLPEGTELQLVLESPLSSATSHVGDQVTARVERATSDDGRII